MLPTTPASPPMGGKKILVVDDEPTVREVMVAYLDRDGFRTYEASDGIGALEIVESENPDLILLDIMLPEVDGLSVLARIRHTQSTPVILLSARADESDRVVGLEMGADDYVTKPFSPREVTARVRVVLKRIASSHDEAPVLRFDGLDINGIKHEVKVDDRSVDLTPREFDLLAFLASSPRQVFSRGQLLDQVWGSSPDWQDAATVTVHIGRIRNKIEIDAAAPRWITTVWGVGYRFEP